MVGGPSSRASVSHGTKSGPNYNQHMELTARTRDTVSGWRAQIRLASELSSAMHLGEVLGRTDIPYPYIVKVLDVHPCLGKVAGRRLLDELGIAHNSHLGGLTLFQVNDISRRCRCDRA